jgi:D-serine deaminase-like pyridoxal phosphate-dependent protein
MTISRRLPSTLSTPALLVDLDVFESNVAAMEAMLEGTGKTVRPHVKTHRTPELARRQLGGAARGVTCSTVGEAEAMVDAGIDDVFVANEVVDPGKIARLIALANAAAITVAVDDLAPLRAISSAAATSGAIVGIIVDVDTGLRRCGVTGPAEAIALARETDRLPGVRFRGLMGYEGRVRASVDRREVKIGQALATLSRVKAALVAEGIAVEVVSGSGTSTLPEALADPTITEVQAGVYALMEPDIEDLGLPFRCAAILRATVISRRPGRIVLDIGRRSAGIEYGPPQPIAFRATKVTANDEHTIVVADGTLPGLGEQVDLRPGQIRTTCNLYDWIWALRGGEIVDCWPVAARGRSW